MRTEYPRNSRPCSRFKCLVRHRMARLTPPESSRTWVERQGLQALLRNLCRPLRRASFYLSRDDCLGEQCLSLIGAEPEYSDFCGLRNRHDRTLKPHHCSSSPHSLKRVQGVSLGLPPQPLPRTMLGISG